MALALVLRAHSIDVVFSRIVYHAPARLSFRETIEALLLINVIYEPEEMRNRIEFV